MQQTESQPSEFDSLVDQLLEPEKPKKDVPNELMGELSELMNGLLQPVLPMEDALQTDQTLSGWAAPIEGTQDAQAGIAAMQIPQSADLPDIPVPELDQTNDAAQTPDWMSGQDSAQPEFARVLAAEPAGMEQAAQTTPEEATAFQPEFGWGAWQEPTTADAQAPILTELDNAWGVPITPDAQPAKEPAATQQTAPILDTQAPILTTEIPDMLADVQLGSASKAQSEAFAPLSQDEPMPEENADTKPQEPVRTEAQPADLAQLVEQARELTPSDWIRATDAPLEAQSTDAIRTQTLDALNEQLTAPTGDDFRIRLTPEGLGDITVQLTHAADGTIQLAMTAANPKTAACLNQELGALQEALLPHGAQITEITAAPPTESGSFMQQQFGQAPDQSPHNHPKQTFSAWGEYAEDDTMAPTQPAPSRSAQTSRLDTYI